VAILISRMPGVCFAARRVAAFLALSAGACLVLAACSPGADYPSLFPAVHDIPPPRTDAPLDANQVQQATEDLISARDRLNTEAQGPPAKTIAAKSAPSAPAKSAGKSAAKPTTDGASAKKEAITQASRRGPPTSDAAQTVGAESK
jgi:hypothetical protein